MTCIEAIAIFGGNVEFTNCGLEAGRSFFKGDFFPGLLENRFRRFAIVCLKHSDHVFGNANKNPVVAFLDNMDAFGVGVNVLSANLKIFVGRKPVRKDSRAMS